MKHLITLITLSFCFGCSNNKQNEDVQSLDSKFGNQLVLADFLKYADSSKIDDQLNEIIKSFDIYDERNNKILHVDAEELAEFNFDFFLPQLNRMLGKRNFQLVIKTAENEAISHEVFLNGEKIKLYTNNDLKKGHFWDKAARAFFKKLNQLLKKSNLRESCFLLYDGNDLEMILLTEKQFNIIAERYKDEATEIPYRP